MIIIIPLNVNNNNKERRKRRKRGGRKSIIWLEGSQASPSRPSDEGRMKVKTL
jgi:hypothetical protein